MIKNDSIFLFANRALALAVISNIMVWPQLSVELNTNN